MNHELAGPTSAAASGVRPKASLLVSFALGLVAGTSVAVVLQDASVIVPFLTLGVLGTPVVHGLRRLKRRMLWRVVAGGAVVGGAGLLIGLFGTDDGALQAAGVLGGAAALAAASLAAATLGAASMTAARRQHSTQESTSHP